MNQDEGRVKSMTWTTLRKQAPLSCHYFNIVFSLKTLDIFKDINFFVVLMQQLSLLSDSKLILTDKFLSLLFQLISQLSAFIWVFEFLSKLLIAFRSKVATISSLLLSQSVCVPFLMLFKFLLFARCRNHFSYFSKNVYLVFVILISINTRQ